MIAEVTVPSPGESITEVTLSAWLKKDGDYVRKDDELFEIESEKATLSVAASVAGKLSIKIAEAETVSVGAVACTIDTSAVAPAEKKALSAHAVESKPVAAEPIASVAARKIMEERGISPQQVTGTGKEGRITKGDALAGSPAESAAPPPRAETVIITGGTRTTGRQKLSSLRLKAAERLVASKNQTAMLTTFNEADMSAIVTARAKYKDQFRETHDTSLGFMSFFIKACCEALKQFPPVNAMIEGNEIIYHDYVDMGIAVSAPKGLVVPVIRNAESLTFAQVESEVARLAARARNNQLTLDEMTGGTFTISNGGVFGSLMSTPILNPPQSAILGMHNIVKRPVAINDQVEIRPMMYLALSYDHRVIDGRESVSFLVRVKELLEDPMRLLLKV
jgi:2-oxoglutarate dehydrogenase E2 component (dihydrolipoamide succinyltransferase)